MNYLCGSHECATWFVDQVCTKLTLVATQYKERASYLNLAIIDSSGKSLAIPRIAPEWNG